MSVIVIRGKDTDLNPRNPFHRMQLSIPWPEGAVSAYREDLRAPWEFTTQSDLLRRRRKRMESRLRKKREYGVVRRRALYVWVFWCPGISNCFNAFRGWWISLAGINFDFDCKCFAGTRPYDDMLRLFPLVDPPLFGPLDIEKWKREFVRRYPRGTWCGKPQGKAPVWAEMEGNRVKILSQAQWPRVGVREEGITIW